MNEKERLNMKVPLGSWHICPVCNKKFFTSSPGEWVFRRAAKTSYGSTTVFFCKWSHLRKWDADHEQKLKRNYGRRKR